MFWGLFSMVSLLGTGFVPPTNVGLCVFKAPTWFKGKLV